MGVVQPPASSRPALPATRRKSRRANAASIRSDVESGEESVTFQIVAERAGRAAGVPEELRRRRRANCRPVKMFRAAGLRNHSTIFRWTSGYRVVSFRGAFGGVRTTPCIAPLHQRNRPQHVETPCTSIPISQCVPPRRGRRERRRGQSDDGPAARTALAALNHRVVVQDSGVYSDAQAEEGTAVYKKTCAECHELEEFTNGDFKGNGVSVRCSICSNRSAPRCPTAIRHIAARGIRRCVVLHPQVERLALGSSTSQHGFSGTGGNHAEAAGGRALTFR